MPRAVLVYFQVDMDGKPIRNYSYKYPENEHIEVGDYVVVPTGPKEVPKIWRVSSIQDNFDWKPGIAWKWIIQKVDMALYNIRKLSNG